MLRILAASLVAASLLLAPSLARAGACAMPTPTTAPIADKVEAPAGGGVLVVQSYDRRGTLNGTGGKVVQNAWRFRANGKLVKPVIEVIAPGLAVYRLPDGAKAPAQLTDGKKATFAALSVAAKPAAELGAPTITSVTYTAHRSRRGTYVSVIAELKEVAPADAVALVIADDKGARSYGLIVAGTKNVALYSSGSCVVLPDDTLPTNGGDKVKLFWVDKSGRKSPSTAVTVKAAPGPTTPGLDTSY